MSNYTIPPANPTPQPEPRYRPNTVLEVLEVFPSNLKANSRPLIDFLTNPQPLIQRLFNHTNTYASEIAGNMLPDIRKCLDPAKLLESALRLGWSGLCHSAIEINWVCKALWDHVISEMVKRLISKLSWPEFGSLSLTFWRRPPPEPESKHYIEPVQSTIESYGSGLFNQLEVVWIIGPLLTFVRQIWSWSRFVFNTFKFLILGTVGVFALLAVLYGLRWPLRGIAYILPVLKRDAQEVKASLQSQEGEAGGDGK
ncbi:uncharacterized protein KY384_008051 [Bacidia gigantensis]|uniref:uncharacterized protein n=1 Tax=Bacidia gigantensis TaxID=2732470 RepID=UPI001D04D9EB|nr:uncharacterized protein KY384_008051 [Bacidia gigantensis]KAG8527307.1 hypothetical protein KY384_008051 [Bacidia gigantensis]